MNADELELFTRSIDAAVAERERPAVDDALARLGWLDAFADDARAAVSIVFEAQGRAATTSSALGQLVATALGIDPSLPILLPAVGSTDPPGVRGGDQVVVDGLGSVAFALDDPEVAVVSRDGESDIAAIVPAAALSVSAVHGVDPWLGTMRVTGRADVGDSKPVLWPTAVALAQLALAHELVGASRRMLELARDHALERIQFGQPIARFQAIRHRLAETLVTIEAADAVLDAAWLDDTPDSAAMAKALAGTAARTAARHCQQVLAGIGFTTEHPLHRYVRRVFALDQLFGSSHALTRELGEQLLTTRQLPPLLPL
jgi:hypothetical protein